MKSILFKLCIVIAFITNEGQPAFNQNNSDKNSRFKLFFEKVYLHTDKAYYVSGESIWYKAYLVNAQSNYPTYTSNNLYVELISSLAQMISRQVIHIKENEGVGYGDIQLPDSIISGTYKLRAYTNWMLNFGNDFIFEKTIEIKNIPSTLKKTIATSSKENATRSTITNDSSQPSIAFFPEGGSLIANVTSNVAFKVEDVNGKGINAAGKIINSKGEQVAAFTTTVNGMGVFNFTPGKDELYEVKAETPDRKKINSELPIALENGFALSVKDKDTSTTIATISTNPSTFKDFENNIFHLICWHGGKTYVEDSIKLTSLSQQVTINKSTLPQGIAVITLYDGKWRPNCERIFFVSKPGSVELTLRTGKINYERDENVPVNFQLYGENVSEDADLSLAVVDAKLVPADADNICSYLWLQSELKGNIENAAGYFDKNNPERFNQLDILLMAQGWREYLWTRLANEKISLKYLPEPGITISGKVLKSEAGKPYPNINVTLFAPQATGSKIYYTTTDSLGKFYLDGLKMEGTQRIKLVAKSDKGKDAGYLFMDSLFNNQLQATAFKNTIVTKDTPVLFTQQKIKNYIEKDKISRDLPDVTVNANNNNTLITRGNVTIKFGYKDSVFNVEADDYKKYKTLINFLHRKMNEAQVDVDSNNLFFWGEKGEKIHPGFFVENKEDVFDRIDYYNLPMNAISKVVVTHRISAIDNNHVYFIYLTLNENYNNVMNPNFINKNITGYYQAKAFYLPRINKNFFDENPYSTIYWIPDLKTIHGQGNAQIFNRGGIGNYKIIVQGITNKGNPVNATTLYNIQQ